jgi:hypothetical protein
VDVHVVDGVLKLVSLYEDPRLLGCNVVPLCEYFLTFQSTIVPNLQSQAAHVGVEKQGVESLLVPALSPMPMYYNLPPAQLFFSDC